MKFLTPGWMKETVSHFHPRKERHAKHSQQAQNYSVYSLHRKEGSSGVLWVVWWNTYTKSCRVRLNAVAEWEKTESQIIWDIFRAYHSDAPSIRPFVYSWTLLLCLLNAVWDMHTTKQDKPVQQDHWEHCWCQVSWLSSNFQVLDVVYSRAGVQVRK